jgi:hypothetical protein
MTHVALTETYRDWLIEQRLRAVAERVSQYLRQSPFGASLSASWSSSAPSSSAARSTRSRRRIWRRG